MASARVRLLFLRAILESGRRLRSSFLVNPTCWPCTLSDLRTACQEVADYIIAMTRCKVPTHVAFSNTSQRLNRNTQNFE